MNSLWLQPTVLHTNLSLQKAVKWLKLTCIQKTEHILGTNKARAFIIYYFDIDITYTSGVIW